MADAMTIAGELPLLTAHLPGTGGVIKTTPADFEVEEIPLYEPSGAGTHSYLWIEKEGLTTFDAIRMIARALGKREREIGYAGLKDSTARTRQWLSVEHVPDLAPLEALPPALRVLKTVAHRNKLRVGHLRGNRFRIRVRGACPGAAERARAVLDALQRTGAPAFFGPQRFGVHGSTHELGRALVRGDADELFERLLAPGAAVPLAHLRAGRLGEALAAVEPGRVHRYEREAVQAIQRASGDRSRALRFLDRRMLRFYVSAYQSFLFNQVLAERLGTCHRLMAGDIAYLHRNGACFAVADATAEQGRADAFEISPTGPLFGPEMLQPGDAALCIEQNVLARESVTADRFSSDLVRLMGARRPLRSPLSDIEVHEDARPASGLDRQDHDLVVGFVLPPGMYASVVLHEVTKAGTLLDPASEAEDPEPLS